MNLNKKQTAFNIRGMSDEMQLIRESLNDSIQDYRISNEISSRKIENLIPALKTLPQGDLFAIGSTIGFYLAGLSRPSKIVLADKYFLITRFNVLYELLLKNLKTVKAIEKVVTLNKFELVKIENDLWNEADAEQKIYLQKTVKSNLKKKGLVFDPSEMIKLIQNLKYHYTLKESYLRDQNKLDDLLTLSHEGKIIHLFKDVTSQEMNGVAAQLKNWDLNFSVFYLSNISDWFPADTMRQQTENLNHWIYAVPFVEGAVVIKSRCSRYDDLFSAKASLVGEKGSWFYETIPLQAPVNRNLAGFN
jgi:hypothetical protein